MTVASDAIKRALVGALRAHLEGEMATMRRLALDAAEAATHEDNRPESDKDMRSTEASYIARGQAARVLDLERELGLLGAIDLKTPADGAAAVGSLVTVRSQGKTSRYFLVPSSGGIALDAAGVKAQTLSVKSPLGAALLGLSEGEEAELSGVKAERVYEILDVSLERGPRDAFALWLPLAPGRGRSKTGAGPVVPGNLWIRIKRSSCDG